MFICESKLWNRLSLKVKNNNRPSSTFKLNAKNQTNEYLILYNINSNVEEYDELMEEIFPNQDAAENIETNEQMNIKTTIMDMKDHNSGQKNMTPTIIDAYKMVTAEDKLNQQLIKS